ncbi:TIGR03089 family protein [Arthrobacter glacialis]|uniref:TIGR03089 family protein n=1 Tax=Arthrobacter glacialis TaxID=1664 RepID=UPI000CD47BF8|nr:TIGR03089 family protein [Arthrobacter glacialis]POH60733.1 TIGR03089 family protein [Arthrobacter glacialis]
MNTVPNTPADLLNSLRSNHATSPRLSWYGPDSERVEFSGRVLDNWVAKTANYLVDELDAAPGTVVAVDLPLHWRSLVWLLATWAVGGTAVTADLPDGADIVATAHPADAQERLAGVAPVPLLVAVALPALQMRWLGELPPRTLDYSGDVRAHADVFFADDAPAPGDVAWLHDSVTTSYAALLAQGEVMIDGVAQPLPAEPQRVLLQVRDGWDAVVPAALKIWAAGGSVVLLDDGVAASDHLRSTENITLG